MLIKTTVMAHCYMDSILILSVSREMMKLPGVKKAVVVMATDMNKTVVDEFGGMTKEEISGYFNPANAKKVLVDIKGILERKDYTTEDYIYWRL